MDIVSHDSTDLDPPILWRSKHLVQEQGHCDQNKNDFQKAFHSSGLPIADGP
jgi:hypothetical protein